MTRAERQKGEKMKNNEEIKEAWERLAADLKSEDPGRYFEKARKEGREQTYICPCGAGTGQGKKNRHTGFKRNPRSKSKYPAYKCPSCGRAGSLVDFVAADRETDYKETLQYMAELYGYPLPGSDRAADPDYMEKQRKRQEENKKKMAEIEKKNREAAEKAAKADYNSYYKACANMLFSESTPEGLAYLKGRGISEKTAKRFWLGYDPEAAPRSAPGGKGRKYKNNTFPRLIIPISKKYYTARYILPGELPENVTKYDQPAGGNIEVFNTKILHNPEIQVIFVVEGALDAIATTEAGGEAVGLNGTGNELKLVKALEEEPTAATLVLCLDNDNAGEKATATLQENLRALGVHYICANIAGSCKDPNEALQNDRAAFIKAVKDAQAQAREYREKQEAERLAAENTEPQGAEMTEETTAQEMQGAQDVKELQEVGQAQEVKTAQEVQNPQEQDEAAEDQKPEETGETTQQEQTGKKTYVPPFTGLFEADFMQYCQTEQHPISTGIIGLDIALKGGLTDELYLLGAETGQGKSALSLNIAENIARAGTDVLYFALEMSRKELIARGISALSWREREKYKDTGAPISAGDIMYFDYDYTLKGFYKIPAKRYEKQAAQYFREYGSHLAIIENNISGLTAAEIAWCIKRHVETTGRKPVVFVDYLQMIAGDRGDKTQADRKSKTDAAIRTLKQISIKYKLPVFAISSLNRIGYGKRVTSASFKESGDLEYTAGVLLGLNLDAQMENYGSDKEAERAIKAALNPGRDKPRKMTLEVMKFRNGERANDVKLDYFATYNCFMMRDGTEGFKTITEEEEKELPFTQLDLFEANGLIK